MKIILVDAVNTLILKRNDGCYEINHNLFKVLETFENKKILVTNADDNQFEMFGLASSPYEVFTLKHNPDKKDPVYFKIFFEKYYLTANDVVYIEHHKEAIDSAVSLGIKSFNYDKDKKDFTDLKDFLLKNL